MKVWLRRAVLVSCFVLPASAHSEVKWPNTLKPVGDGYPSAGDPCRKLGSSEATDGLVGANETLVGCPGDPDGAFVKSFTAKHRGKVISVLAGISLISIGDKKEKSKASPHAGAADAKIKGTPFHARGDVRCVLAAGQSPQWCPFGVIRKGDGSAIVKITVPGGGRTLDFTKGKVRKAQIDGAPRGAKLKFEAKRTKDVTSVKIGNERYDIEDAIVFGG